MGIPIADPDDVEDDDEADGERQLSDNVLVIEISGPDVHGLSVIDFPGFLHSMPHSKYFHDRLCSNFSSRLSSP